MSTTIFKLLDFFLTFFPQWYILSNEKGRDNIEIGERIKAVRKTRKLTLAQLGDMVGVSPQAIGNIEKNTNNPSEQTIRAITAALGVSDEWLRNGTGEMYPTRSRQQAIEEYVAKLLNGNCSGLEELLIEWMSRTTAEEWAALSAMVARLVDSYNENKPDN